MNVTVRISWVRSSWIGVHKNVAVHPGFVMSDGYGTAIEENVSEQVFHGVRSEATLSLDMTMFSLTNYELVRML